MASPLFTDVELGVLTERALKIATRSASIDSPLVATVFAVLYQQEVARRLEHEDSLLANMDRSPLN